MVTKEQLEHWLTQQNYSKHTVGVFENSKSGMKYEIFDDHYRKFQHDKSGHWLLMEVTTYVDLFIEKDGEITNKWHHVVGKNLSPYFK